jgi:hypothetical protein
MDLLYNKPGLVFGFPIFIVGTTGLSLGMIVVAFIMYFVEDKQERLANNNQAAYGDSRTNGADQ